MLKCPDYLKLKDGRLDKICCKVCGTPIAEVNEETGVLKRHTNYVEAKLAMDNGSFHVTCLCRMCLLDVVDSRDMLQELHDADIYSLAMEMPSIASEMYRRVLRVTVADFHQRGIT